MGTPEFGTTETDGARLRRDRTAAGIDPRTFAELVGYSRSHIRAVETGHRPITEQLAGLAAAVLGTDPARYLTQRG